MEHFTSENKHESLLLFLKSLFPLNMFRNEEEVAPVPVIEEKQVSSVPWKKAFSLQTVRQMKFLILITFYLSLKKLKRCLIFEWFNPP